MESEQARVGGRPAVRPAVRPAAAAVAGLLAAVIVCHAARPEADSARIEFQAGPAAALRQGQARKVVTVVYFSAPWCTWCRKMSVTTFTDRDVVALAGRFAWAKVDVDEDPEPAAEMGVRGVPHVALLNVEGRVIDAHGGYMSPEVMVKFLRKSVDKAEAAAADQAVAQRLVGQVAQAGLSATQPGRPAPALVEAVERLAAPDRVGRRELSEAVARLGPGAWGGLAVLMEDKRLAVRAAAGEALAGAAGADLPFDPFAPPAARNAQVAAWKKWIEQNKSGATTRPTSRRATTSAPAGRPAGEVAR